jgi:hypothetical protein
VRISNRVVPHLKVRLKKLPIKSIRMASMVDLREAGVALSWLFHSTNYALDQISVSQSEIPLR